MSLDDVPPPLIGMGDGLDEEVFITHHSIPLPSLLQFADEALEQKGGLATLEALLRAARSTGPKEILIKLAVNRHLLHLQLAAVRIQGRIRRFLAIRRVDKIRRRFQLFQRITAALSCDLAEEVVLGGCLELVMQVILTHERYHQHKYAVESLLMDEVADIAEEVVQSLSLEVVVEIVEQATEKLLQHRPKPHVDELRASRNPLIQIMLILADDEVDRMVRPVVVEAILEEVDDYLLRTHGVYIYNTIESSTVEFLAIETLFNLLLNDADFATNPAASAMAGSLWDQIEGIQGGGGGKQSVVGPVKEDAAVVREEAKSVMDFVLKTAFGNIAGIQH